PVIVIQSYAKGVAGVHTTNPDVKVSIAADSALPNEPVLLVQYPGPTGDPAGRDVWCDAENPDWTSANGIAFQIKPTNPERLSISFFDRNHVVYTTWVDLQGGAWQPVRITFADLRPNPYFQPPDAKTGAPLDLGEIKGLAFAPHHDAPGQFAVSKLVLTR
ncbi:MAG TPA: carbohydrate binding domain-containing protein, partial [Polyangiaceae bacterium]|nr:carbohydrate binding domain-containing protein [Polyangiaceae bacterium]